MGLFCFWSEGSFAWMARVGIPSISMPSLGIGDAGRFDPWGSAAFGREFGCFLCSLASGTMPVSEEGLCLSSWPMGAPNLAWVFNL